MISCSSGGYTADENETASIITTINALHQRDASNVKLITPYELITSDRKYDNSMGWEVYEIGTLGISVTFDSHDAARKNAIIKKL